MVWATPVFSGHLFLTGIDAHEAFLLLFGCIEGYILNAFE